MNLSISLHLLPNGDIKHVPAYSSETPFADWVKDFKTACPSDLDYILTGEEERYPDPDTDNDEEFTGNRARNYRNCLYRTQPFSVQDLDPFRSTEHFAGQEHRPSQASRVSKLSSEGSMRRTQRPAFRSNAAE